MFAALRDILAGLYPDETSARRVVDDAGLDPALISFSSHARNNWHGILAEADKQDKVDDLLTVAFKEYEENAELQDTWQAYRHLVEQGGRISPPPKEPTDDGMEESAGSDVPEWFWRAGVLFGALTLLFFMGLVIASLFAVEVPDSSRFSVVVVLALGSALATSFLGGKAVAEGRIAIPFLQNHPLKFSTGGGIAVLIIILLLGYGTYGRSTPPPRSEPLVYSVDSMEPEQIYLPGKGTNTAHIRKILQPLPIQVPAEELVYMGWDNVEDISEKEPDLIIIHRSAFYTTTTTLDPAKAFGAFLEAMEDTDTRFLIYSRGFDFEDEEGKKHYYEDKFPFLNGLVEVLWVARGDPQYCTYWDCLDIKVKMRSKASSLLGLP